MRSFFDLVGFEYKKIFKRKSAIIALILVIVAVCISPLTVFFGTTYVDGEPFESQYQAMIKDREYARALSGLMIDENLMSETKDAYSKITSDDRFGITQEYQLYARPYQEIFWMLNAVYNMEDLKDLTEEDMRNFYQARHDMIEKEVSYMTISDAAKEKLIELDSEIKTPFSFEYTGGFDSLFGSIYTLGIVCAFALAICLAPMFAGEYSSRTDQMILSSKLGKTKQVTAKLFTAISLFVVLFAILLLISIILVASIYGLDGADAPIQLLSVSVTYPLTILQNLLIFLLSTFLGIFLIVAVILLLSSKFRSPFSVIIVVSVLLFIPMMITVPETIVWLHNLFNLLPTNMMTIWGVFNRVVFDLFGLIIVPYVFLPIFATIASVAMLPFARRAFQNHQVG